MHVKCCHANHPLLDMVIKVPITNIVCTRGCGPEQGKVTYGKGVWSGGSLINVMYKRVWSRGYIALRPHPLQ